MNKKISICLPCMNEVENVGPISEAIIEEMAKIPQYDYEIIFSDNCSTDGTQDALREVCKKHKNVRAILNARNFQDGSGFNLMFSASGDCVIFMPSDFQVPVGLIPKMLEAWENGSTVVVPVKTTSKENKLMLFMRHMYYRAAKMMSESDTLPGYTGCGLYDRSFLDISRSKYDEMLDFRPLINKYAVNLVKIPYVEEKRRAGKSKNNFSSLFQIAVSRIIANSSVIPYFAILGGGIIAAISIVVAIVYFILKLIYWNSFPIGVAPIVIGVFFMGAIQLMFIGFIGAYVIDTNKRIRCQKFPLVIEKERLNFDEEGEEY